MKLDKMCQKLDYMQTRSYLLSENIVAGNSLIVYIRTSQVFPLFESDFRVLFWVHGPLEALGTKYIRLSLHEVES